LPPGAHAVLGLVEDDGLRAVDHRIGDLLTAVRREAMHHPRASRRACQESVVDLQASEILSTPLLLRLLAHAGPDVRIHDVGVAQCGVHVVRDREGCGSRTQPHRAPEHGLAWLLPRWPANAQTAVAEGSRWT